MVRRGSAWPRFPNLAGRLVAPLGFIRKDGDHVLLRPDGVASAKVDRLAEWLVEQGASSAPPHQAG